MLVLPPFSSPDENIHFISSNRLANQIMMLDEEDEEGNVYIREQDNRELVQSPGKQYMKDFYSAYNEKPEATADYVPNLEEKATATFSLNYLFQALGVVIGRVSGMNFFQLVLMGRIFNLAMFAGIVYIAICKMPFGKWTLFIVSQFPMSLELISSYSYDTIVIALAFLYTALCFYYIYDKKSVKWPELSILFLLGIVMSPLKVAYVPIVLLVFLIPYSKMPFKTKLKCIFYKMGIFLVSCIMIMVMNLGKMTKVVGSMAGAAIQEEQRYTVACLLEDKTRIISLAGNTLIDYLGFYINTMFGGLLGWLEIEIPFYIVAGFLLLFLISLFQREDKYVSVMARDKLWALLLLLATFCALHTIYLFSYTPMDYSRIRGLQGRLFLPFLPLLILVALNGAFRFEKKIPEQLWVLGSSALNLFTMLTVFETILKR